MWKAFKYVALSLGLLAIGFAVGLAEMRQRQITCKHIEIHVVGDPRGAGFLPPAHLQRLLVDKGAIRLGEPIGGIALRRIVSLLKTHNFVDSVVAYRTWSGTLKIRVSPKCPVARLLGSGVAHTYLARGGTLLPWSDQYVMDVPLVEWMDREVNVALWLRSQEGEGLWRLLQYIDQDPFWRIQVVHVGIDAQGKVMLRMRVGQQVCVLGRASDAADNLKKLRLFYEEIVPVKGWNRYKRVNVSFDHQIVCE